MDLISQKNLDNEHFQLFKKEMQRKLSEQQLEIENLREYIKKRSKEDTQHRHEEKSNFESERKRMNAEMETLKQDHTALISEKESHIRSLVLQL